MCSSDLGYLADRFTYVAYFGLFFILAAELKVSLPGRTWTWSRTQTALAVYLLVFGVMTFRQTKTWRDGEALWTQALRYEVKTDTPYINRGQFYRDTKRPDLAMRDFLEAVRLAPKAETFNSIGKLYFDQGNAREAILYYDQGIAKRGTIGELYINRGSAHGMLGELEKA